MEVTYVDVVGTGTYVMHVVGTGTYVMQGHLNVSWKVPETEYSWHRSLTLSPTVDKICMESIHGPL